MTRTYGKDEVPKCQWEGCHFDAASHVFTEDQSSSIFVCRQHRGVVEINLQTTGRLRIDQASNALVMDRPGQKTDYKGPRPGASEQDWEKQAAIQADAAAVPIEEVNERGQYAPEGKPKMRGIVSDVPTPRRSSE